ncbi:MAG TPA: enolase C-terminal domain-like protein, partial [Anaerolineales bacterium]
MKISSISLYHLSMALRSPFETSFGRSEMRDCILIEARSGDITAYGECVADRDPGYSYETVGTAWHVLRDYLIPAILEVDLQGAGDLQQRLAAVRGHPMAKAGLEMALWDLQGKLSGCSLRQMLGGNRTRVDVGVSVGLQASPAALVETVGSYLQQGYRRIKIKIKPGRDVQDAQAVRRAFPEVRLQVDANSAYTLETAAVLKPLDDLD